MKPFSVEDLLHFELIRDLHVRPDGAEIAYEIRTIDEASDDYVSSLAVVATTGGPPIELVPATSVNMTPRWSPDGRLLAFVSDRSGTRSLYVIARDGGEARKIKSFPRAVSGIAWSPDGRTILGSVVVAHADPPAGVDPSSTTWTDRPRRVTRQRYKSDSAGFLLDGTSRLYPIRVADGDARLLPTGDGDVTGGVSSPDGRRIAYAMSRAGARDAHITDLWVIDADGANPRRLTEHVVSAAAPAWSPDGRYLAFTGHHMIGTAYLRVGADEPGALRACTLAGTGDRELVGTDLGQRLLRRSL